MLARILLAGLLMLPGWRAFAQNHGLPERPTVGPYLNGVLPPVLPTAGTNWSAVVAFPNLSFLNPVGITQMPGQNRMVVWEREGRIYSFEKNPATPAKTLVLDLSAVCQGWGDAGLLGLAFHPKFSLGGEAGTNRHVFLWYNHVRPGMTVQGGLGAYPNAQQDTINRLARFTLDANGIAIPGSELVFIDQNDTSVWHNGGGMFFHPENGFLYITNGDDTVSAHTRTISGGLFSCVIRIDVDQRGGAISHPPPRTPTEAVTANYYIPNDNPFVGVPNANEEIFATGLRSPHRMTIDPITKRIFIGDVGQETWEEITVIEPSDPPGLNLQWDLIEGLNGDLTPPYIGVNKRPIIHYGHNEGNAVIGGYVYRGQEFAAELGGKYIFADNGSRNVWYLDESTTPATKVFLANVPLGTNYTNGIHNRGISSFGVDSSGELYICQMSSVSGRIYKLQRNGAPAIPLPAKISDAGVFSDLAALTPSDKLVPYTLIQPFWSDRAIKTRWAAIPSEQKVGFTPTGEWTWPEGSVFVKHFDLPVDDSDPTVRRRLETRLLVKTASGETYGATYKWRADNSDADLLDTPLTENIPITIAPAGAFTGEDVGGPAQPGSTQRTNNLVTIQAGGVGIGGVGDQFHFAHQQRTGDFDLSVRMESLGATDLYAKAGLMARESLAASSPSVLALVYPSNDFRNNNNGGYEFQYRQTAGGHTTSVYPALPQPLVNFPNTWLRLRREGDVFISYWSSDGVWWTEYARQTVDLPDTVFFGLAATAHSPTGLTTAKFHLQTTRMQPWYYPGRNDCTTCHSPASGGVLGPKTRQLNGDFLYPNGVTDNQLRAWAHAGLFDEPPAEASLPNLDQLATQNDLTAPLEKRARSYLDANCANCHRPGGAHSAFWDARFDTPLPQQGLLYGFLGNDLGNLQNRVIVPQDPGHSVLHRRISTVGPLQMPPLARNLTDQGGADLLAQWIQSLAPNTPPTVALTVPHQGTAFIENQPITLRASASDTDGIQKVEFFYDLTKIGEDTTAPYEVIWTGASEGTHHLRASALDHTGSGSASKPVGIFVQRTPLPTPWKDADIGFVALRGGARHSAGQFHVSSSGTDIWNAADGFHMVYQPMIGDGEISARVVSLKNTDQWAKGGVMMRETLDPGSRHAGVFVTPGNGTTFVRRLTANGTSVSTPGPVAQAPYWVRLVRSGNTFTSYVSPDGHTWSLVGSMYIGMQPVIYAGLALSSHTNANLCDAVFTDVNFSNTPPVFSTSVNFQPAAAAVPPGYLVDGGLVFGPRGNGFSHGWNQNNTGSAIDRNSGNSPDQRYDTYITATGRTWEIAVPNAAYRVRIVAGDATVTGQHQFAVEGQTLINGTTTTAQRFLDATGVFIVTDGKITITPGASLPNSKICFVDISSFAPATNVLPVAEVTSPPNGAVFTDPTEITIQAAASDPDNAIVRVEFLVDGAKVGEDTIAPYQWVVQNPAFGTHTIAVRATNDAGGVVTSATSEIMVQKSNLTGFRGEYFHNSNFTDPAFVRSDPEVNFDWQFGAPDPRLNSETFSVRWSTRLRPRYSETYTFTTITDDGARLWVNGQLLVDAMVNQFQLPHSGTITLQADQEYDLVMEYYDGIERASARLYWSSATQLEEAIPASRTSVPVTLNSLPLITLTGPVAGHASLPGDTLTLSATASDLNGAISRVEFWADGLKLGHATSPPFSLAWAGPRAVGSHTIWATAIDNLGASASTFPATVQTIPLVLTPASVQQLTDPTRVVVTLRFLLPAGRSYVVEWSGNLTDWAPLESGTSTGTEIEVTDVSPDPKRFYRVKLPN